MQQTSAHNVETAKPGLTAWLSDASRDDLPRGWTFAQKGLFVVVAVMLTHATIGFVANPDFATGSDATAKEVLLVEFNGWHALAGYLLGLPALAALLHARWAVAMAAYLAVALIASGAWILADHDAAGFVPFGDGATRDALYHFTLGAAYAAVGFIGWRKLGSRDGR